jgi:prepilin-type processing-associated H-X9-DG protein
MIKTFQVLFFSALCGLLILFVSGCGFAEAQKTKAQNRMQCHSNLKQIAFVLHNFHDANNTFPPLYTVDRDGKPLHSWRVLILPYMEQTELYNKIRLDEPWDSEYNKQFYNAVIDAYRCPSHSFTKKNRSCCYSAIAGEVMIPAKEAGKKTGMWMSGLSDGTSKTLAVVEVKEPFCWMDPTADITLDELSKGINKKNGRVGSRHTRGMNAAFFDGSVQFIPNTVSPDSLKAAGTRAGGENVSLP